MHLDCDDPLRLGADAVNGHYESAFVLVTGDGTPDKGISLAKGYTP